VIEGTSTIDEAMVTGESVPVKKQPGDEVIGATINKTGSFKFRATRVWARYSFGANCQVGATSSRCESTDSKIGGSSDGVVCACGNAIAIANLIIWFKHHGQSVNGFKLPPLAC
jgi:Cu+-exporting ATPase